MKLHKQHAQRIRHNRRYNNRAIGRQKGQKLYSVVIDGTTVVDAVLPEMEARIHNMLMNTMTRARYQVKRFGTGPSLSAEQLKEALQHA